MDLTSNDRTAIGNVPPVTAVGQGGLLDVRVTTLRNTLWVYLALSGVNDNQTTGTELWRARLQNKALTDVTQLYAMPLTTTSGHHFGGRIALTDQHVFLTIGDRGERERAQDVQTQPVRLSDSTLMAASHPTIQSSHQMPVQNCIRAPKSSRPADSKGHLYAHEHGPQGDEINRIEAGLTMVGQLLPMDATTDWHCHRRGCRKEG